MMRKFSATQKSFTKVDSIDAGIKTTFAHLLCGCVIRRSRDHKISSVYKTYYDSGLCVCKRQTTVHTQ